MSVKVKWGNFEYDVLVEEGFTVETFKVQVLRSEKADSSSNRPGSAESGPIIITMEMFGPVGPISGRTSPNISIVIVFNSNRARPGPLLLLFFFSLRRFAL